MKQVPVDDLQQRWRGYAAGRQWEACLEIATALTGMVPEERVGWMYRAVSLGKLRRTTEAKAVLLETLDKLGPDSVCAFHLACFCAHLGEVEEAATWVRKAIESADSQEVLDRLHRWVLEEPELQPVWKDLGERPHLHRATDLPSPAQTRAEQGTPNHST